MFSGSDCECMLQVRGEYSRSVVVRRGGRGREDENQEEKSCGASPSSDNALDWSQRSAQMHVTCAQLQARNGGHCDSWSPRLASPSRVPPQSREVRGDTCSRTTPGPASAGMRYS